MNANERDELLRRSAPPRPPWPKNNGCATTSPANRRVRTCRPRPYFSVTTPLPGRGRLPTAAETRIRARLRSRPRRYLLRGLAAAATILLLVLAVNGWQRTHLPAIGTFPMAETTGESTVDWSRYEITDPEEAARVLVKSLRTVSQEMATGKEKAAPLRQLKLLSDPLDTAGLPQ